MNNTALRAGVQSADNTHLVFTDKGYERFYYEKLEQAVRNGMFDMDFMKNKRMRLSPSGDIWNNY